MNAMNALRARANGTSVGTETICAPTVSFRFHPNPFAGPYLSTMVLGAISTVL